MPDGALAREAGMKGFALSAAMMPLSPPCAESPRLASAGTGVASPNCAFFLGLLSIMGGLPHRTPGTRFGVSPQHACLFVFPCPLGLRSLCPIFLTLTSTEVQVKSFSAQTSVATSTYYPAVSFSVPQHSACFLWSAEQ